MKILVISPSFLPILGGTEVAIYEISKRLGKRGYDVTIVTPKDPAIKNSRTWEKMGSFQIYRFPVSDYMYKFSPLTRYIDIQLRALSEIIKLNRKKKFDVFHQFHLFALGGAVVLAKKLLGKPLITTLAGWDTYDPITPVPRFIYPYLTWIMKESDFVTSISGELASHARLQGFKGDIEVIPHGVDLKQIDKYLAHVKDAINNRLDHYITLISVHRLVPRKATYYLLEAFKIVTDKRKDVRLIIVGDGPEKKRLVEVAKKLGIEKCVSFVGEKGRSEIWSYYLSSDIFVLHTLYEGLGIVLLEAMACKKPVICTIAGATKEVVEHGKTGLLVPPRNPKALADAIIKLVDDEELRIKMGMEGRKKVEREYDLDVIVGKYIKLYRRCVNG